MAAASDKKDLPEANSDNNDLIRVTIDKFSMVNLGAQDIGNVVHGLELCSTYSCDETCHYYGRNECADGLMSDASFIIQALWERLNGHERN